MLKCFFINNISTIFVASKTKIKNQNMKLHKALKLKKKLIGEIEALKSLVRERNSYAEGSLDPEKQSTPKYYETLIAKTEELIGLKVSMNDANRLIQGKIYRIAELKGIVSTLNGTSTKEGIHADVGFRMVNADKTYHAQMSEEHVNSLKESIQTEIETLQDEIESYNFSTEI